MSVFADTIGVGSNPDMFGRRQLVGTLAGVIMFTIGIMLIFEKPKNRSGQLTHLQEKSLSSLPSPTGTLRRRLLTNSPPNKAAKGQ